ncbi:uncharacterized protein LOC120625011 [Pararge aegeria]|uniref:uncharacterized protein LOC120625011 n=1 Tax=Pararge aegeria TaxID=116150 RepID=UPI0019D214DF|nr:uncharacterized protein LOC120625011 [Pararge aegeria]
MFKTVLFLLSCIFMLVTTNPLQGFYSYPFIHHQDDFRYERPILVQPSDFISYPQLFLNQNQLPPSQNTITSYNDYLQQIYLQNYLQKNLAEDQNGFKIKHYASDTAASLTPNVAKNYYLNLVAGNILKNKTIDCKREGKCKTRVSNKGTPRTDAEQKTISKCRKKNNSKNKIDNRDRNKCSRKAKNVVNNNKFYTKDVKECKGNGLRNKSHIYSRPTEIDVSVDLKKQTSAKNSYIRTAQVENTNKNIKLEKGLKCIDNEDLAPEVCKTDKRSKNKSKHCRKEMTKDVSYNYGQIKELDDYFNINEDCAYLDNRCTRNDDSVKKYQQKYNPPSDFSYNMAPYMTNFDYLYNMQQFPFANSNISQRRPINRRTNRRKKQKKSNKKNCDQVKIDFQQAGCEKKVDIYPKLDNVARSELASTVSNKEEESQIEKTCKAISEELNVEIKESFKDTENSKVNLPNDSYELNHKAIFDETLDDYYPEFHSDNFYTSKEEYDWSNFRDKHYYSSSDMGQLGRERRKYDSTDDIPTNQNGILAKNNLELKPATNIKIENKDMELLTIKVHNNNVNQKMTSEDVQFRTPPALDFPDFKTEMINKDRNIPLAEIYYQPNKITVNRYNNNKISTFSNAKKVESNEKRHKIIDQNYVETVLGHSKVAKYGTPPVNSPDYSDEELKTPKNSDGKTIVVIAKSLPYPI